jgi:hypothetical protein
MFEGAMTEDRAFLLGNRLIHYARSNPEAITFTKFYEQEKIRHSSMQRWRKQYPVLDIAYEITKEIFAERRAFLAQKMDNKFISSEMHLYSALHEEYKALEHERKKELKNIAEKHNNMDNVREVIKQLLEPLV